MPSLAVSKNYISKLLGEDIEQAKFEQLVFDFGIELDDTYEENGETMYKLDIAANRYDLLCAEGLSYALKSYITGQEYTNITVHEPKYNVIKDKTHERYHIAAAIIKGIDLSKDAYQSLISYQDKLHLSIGRNRSLVAIGTHDLDKINGQIVYKSVNLEEISFAPLNSSNIIKGSQLKKYFNNDKKLSKYFSLLSNEKKSVAFFCNDQVISVPPIINSDATKISENTKNIFIEVTGTDFNKVNTTLKLILSSFKGTSIEAVQIKEEAQVFTTPVLSNRSFSLEIDKINKKLNLNLSAEEIKGLLEKMMYSVQIGQKIQVKVPEARSDVLHECDIIEDIAIAYGFNNFEKRLPEICTHGSEDILNKFTDKVRQEFALDGFNEVLTLTLLSAEENFVNSEKQAIIANPKSKETEVVRTSLLPGLLKSISSNLHAKIPIKIFEAADVVFLDSDSTEGASNRRHLCGLLASNTAKLEEIQGPLSFLFEKCGFKDYGYKLKNEERYLEKQSASILLKGREIGSIGVLHPNICNEFKIPYAASSFELDLEEIYQEFIKLI